MRSLLNKLLLHRQFTRMLADSTYLGGGGLSFTMPKTYFIGLEATRRHEKLKPPHMYNSVVTPCPAPGWVDGGEGAFQFYSARDFFFQGKRGLSYV
jgi:hypothetical protein